MQDIFYKSKVDSALEFTKQIKKVLETEHDHFPMLVPYGMQHHYTLGVPKPIRCCLHTLTSRAHTFIIHYGAGVNNSIAAWTQDSAQPIPRKVLKDRKIGYWIKKITYINSHFVYVAACSDLRLRVLGSHLEEYSSVQMQHTVFDLLYCERLGIFMTCGVGLIQAFKLGFCLHDPPYLVKEVYLPSVHGDIPWIIQLSLYAKRNEILAVCHQGVFFISQESIDEICCKNVLENRHTSSVTCAVPYPCRHYVIVGYKDGNIKAWNTTMQRFPLFGSFLGHTKEVLHLAIHSNEPLLFSSSVDQTIRIWNIETFLETYRFNAQEPISFFKLMGPSTILYSTLQHIKVWELNLFYILFTSVGARALRLSRVSGKNLPTRIMYLGGDGGVRLISPLHGSVLNMTFPIMNHQIIDVLHHVRTNAMYVLLENGNMMVFSTETNPCSTMQLWAAQNYDDRICSIETLESALLESDKELLNQSSLLFGGHVSGHISLLKGKYFYLDPCKAHQGKIAMLKTRKYNRINDRMRYTAHLISYGSDNMVVIWDVKVRYCEVFHSELVLSAIMRIDMVNRPKEMILVANTFTMITQQSLLMYNMENRNLNMTVTSYNQADFVAKCSKQDHFGKITQMCSCESLCVIATCGNDGHVRLWDTNNNLVRELSFDEGVEGLCFNNDRGDLLIGLQSNLYHVPAWKYLTQSYLKKLLEMDIKDDEKEKCISFDQLLKFWYNDFWVSTLPIGRTNMGKVCRSGKKSIGLNAAEYARLRTILLLKSSLEGENSDKLVNFLNTKNARRRSTVVKISSDATQSRQQNLKRCKTLPPVANTGKKFGCERNFKNICEEENVSEIQVSSVKNKEANQDNDPDSDTTEKNDVEKRICHSIEEKQILNKAFDCEVNEYDQLHDGNMNESYFWPCAPDGYIPNSVVRETIQPSAPRDYTELIRQVEEQEEAAKFKKMLFDITMLPKLTTSDPTLKPDPVIEEPEVLMSQKRPMEYVWSSESEEEVEVNSKMEDIFETSSKKTDDQERKPDDAEIVPNAAQTSKIETKNQKKPVRRLSLSASKEESRKKSKPKNKEIEQIAQEKVETETTNGTVQVFPELNNELQNLEPNPQQSASDEVPDIFRRRMTKPWFPQNVDMEVPSIVRDLIGTLKSADALTTRDICALLLEIQSHLGMTTAVLDEVYASLHKLTKCETTAVKHSALKTMIELGESREEVILNLLDLLMDPAQIIRSEAKNGLAQLAGIGDFKSLCNAMQNMHLLKEEQTRSSFSNDAEIFQELQCRKFRSQKKEKDRPIEKTCKNSISNWLSEAKPCLNDGIYEDSDEGDLYEFTEAERAFAMQSIERAAMSEIPQETSTAIANRIEAKKSDFANCKLTSPESNFESPFEDECVEADNVKKVVQSIAPKLYKKFQQSQQDSRLQARSLQSNSISDSLEIADCLRTKIDDILNKLYSDIGSTADNTNGNFVTNNKDKEIPTSQPVPCKNKTARISHPKSKSENLKQKQRLLSSLWEVSMYALMVERTTIKFGSQALDEETLKSLTSLFDIIRRKDVDISRIADQALLLINTIKTQLQAADVMSKKYAAEMLTQQTDNAFEDVKVHQRRLIQSPIGRTMVRGIRGERIAEAIEVSRFSKSSCPESEQRRIFGIPERLGSFAAVENGSCQFGKMKMSWTSRAPCYDMDLALLNEQRIRPLKLLKRPVLYDGKPFTRRHRGPSMLPSLVKKRMKMNSNIFSKQSKRLNSSESKRSNVVKLPLLESNVGAGSNRSASTVSMNSDFNQLIDSIRTASHPPPPPNTAELA